MTPRQTTSRWPGGPPKSNADRIGAEEKPRRPRWAEVKAEPKKISRLELRRTYGWHWIYWGAGLLLLCVAMLAMTKPVRGIYTGITDLSVIIAAFGLGVAGLRGRAMEASLRAQSQKNNIIFEQAGLSLWLEDWTAVGESLIELMNAGITDVQSYFTTYPELARQLRKKVIIKDVNAFTVKMMGASDKSVFLGPLDRILPDTDQTFIEWLIAFERGDLFYRSETHITRPDGTHLDTLFTAALPENLEGFKNILVGSLDITDYKNDQAKLVQAEMDIARVSRVTTIGALTASITHELNSPLAAIVSNAEASLRWLRRQEPDLTEAKAAIARVIDDSMRASEVLSRTRNFLSNSPKRATAINIAETVRQSIVLIDRELRAYGVSLHFDPDESLPTVSADPIQIQQVLVNLMINGAQAMSTINEPRDLTVTVRNINQEVRVDVRDIGEGITQDNLTRIFDPFVSTKPNGMGMGLAICRNCIEAHGGRLHVKSEMAKGTTFFFTLPALVESK